ncbi:MAG: molybdate ABC transporter substrate-binding protein [Eubacteriales bacterium]
MKKKVVIMVFLLTMIVGLVASCKEKNKKSEINVIAAASLTEVFTKLKYEFETQEPEPSLQVNITFAGSQSCVTQIKEGGNFDVFASANTKYMTELIDDGYVAQGQDKIFGKNELVFITNKDVAIESIEELYNNNYSLIIADEVVPIGEYTLEMLDNFNNEKYGEGFSSKILKNVVSKESNVKFITSKVEVGEADVGIVYKTDVTKANSNKLNIIEVEDSYNILAIYYIAPLKDNNNPELVKQWIDFVLSIKGKNILSEYGFYVE